MKTKTNTDCLFFNQIKRITNEFIEFSSLYKKDELDLFEICLYSQNFNIMVYQLISKMDDKDFMIRNLNHKEDLDYYLNFFIQAYQLVEKIRIEKSKVQIFINEFVFSKN